MPNLLPPLLTLFICAHAELHFRESAGVLFTEQARSIRRHVGCDRLNFALQLPNFDRLTDSLKPVELFLDCQSWNEMKLECEYSVISFKNENAHLLSLTNIYNKEIAQLDTDLNALSLAFKSKRALLNIGGFLSSIFGVASQSDLDNLQTQILHTARAARNNYENINSMFEYITKFKNNTYLNFNKIQAHMNATNSALLTTVQRLDNVTGRINDITTELSELKIDFLNHDRLQSATIRLIEQTTSLQAAITDVKFFRTQVHRLLQGKLPHDLIPLSAIQEAVNRLQSSLNDESVKPLQPVNNNRY